MRFRFPHIDRPTAFIVIAAVFLGALYMVAATWVESHFADVVPSSSALSRSVTGLSVWHDYLAELGLGPQLLTDFAALPATGTIVMAPPFENEPTAADAQRLKEWITGGGRLVIVGSDSTAFMLDMGLITSGVSVQSAVASTAVPVLPGPLTQGVGSIATGSNGTAVLTGPEWVALYSDGHGTAVATRSFGNGRVEWLLDPRPVNNDGIALADDARFAVRIALASPGPVYFDEYHHGLTSETTAWDRLGTGGRAAVWLILAAVAVLLLARGRRTGPAITHPEVPAARGTAYMTQLAELYRAAGARAEALAGLEDALTRAIARRYGTKEIGLARQPGAREALARSAALRQRGRIDKGEFVTTAALLRAARNEVEGGNG
jgi:hypothetical protein